MSKFYFSEEQKFSQIWVWVILLPIVLIAAVQLFNMLSDVQDEAVDNEALIALVISFVVAVGVAFLFLSMKLETKIDEFSIKIRFYPFLNRKIDWQEVDKAYVRTYKPIMEYGGWGIRRRIGSIAYSVSGKEGLQLELTNGKKVLIGTKKAQELEMVINKRTDNHNQY